jgi:hypothetical protein
LHLDPYGAIDWYRVVEAGFGIVDDECRVYFSELFAFDRDLRATRSTLNVFQQTANAILAATGASTLNMAVVAQAFSLGTSMTDVVAGTYLYRLPPAPTKVFVAEMMGAYEAESGRTRAAVTSSESAYRRIQGYLDLCLPVTIEANLVNYVGDAVASADLRKGGANPRINVSSSNSGLILSDLIAGTQGPLPPAGTNRGTGIGLNEYERSVPPEFWISIQNALCIGKDGRPGDETHKAIAAFFEGKRLADPAIMTRGIGPYHMTALEQAVDDANGRSCSEMGYADAHAVGRVYSSNVPAGQQ